MHRFLCLPSPDLPYPPDLRGAHLVGADGVPLRAEIMWDRDAIRATPRMQDPVGLSLLWPVKGFGTVQLQTTRLPAREEPYNLHVELARHQLMRVTVKREEWGLFDFNGMEEIAAKVDRSRDEFIRALQHADDAERAARHADESLRIALWAAEEMAAFHASVFLKRRQSTGGFGRAFLGVTLPDGCRSLPCAQFTELCDFVCVPFVWRSIRPTEHGPTWDALDACVKTCATAKLALRGGPLLAFGVRSVPDWMYIWENDFESIYEAAREHVEQCVRRYAKQFGSWIVASGLQADNVFGFSFEQMMELTRMAATVTKQIAPRSQVLIDLTQPWGEYYARNQQTIPPALYAEMAVQSGISFDGFGLQLLFGIDSDGFHLRDPFQVSALIDKLANLGKPLHITALGVPSVPAEGGRGGQWHAPWSDEVQADWLVTLSEVALSKPYLETICLQPLVDSPDAVIPSGGLLKPGGQPKPAFARLTELRQRLIAPEK